MAWRNWRATPDHARRRLLATAPDCYCAEPGCRWVGAWSSAGCAEHGRSHLLIRQPSRTWDCLSAFSYSPKARRR